MEAAREIADVASSSKEIEMKYKNLYDDKLWEEFEEEEIDRILRGERTPKNLIIALPIPLYLKQRFSQFLEREHLIVKELLSVFPNSKTMEWETYMPLKESFTLAKRMGFTSLIFCRSRGHIDEMHITSLLNGAYATFRVFDLIPRDIALLPPNHGNPPTNVVHPQLCMEGFKSPASGGTARLIQSLFPKVSVSVPPSQTPPSRRRSIVSFKNQKSRIYFRHHRLKSVEALPGEKRRRVIHQECRPEFSLMLTSLLKISFNNGRMNLRCVGKGKDIRL